MSPHPYLFFTDTARPRARRAFDQILTRQDRHCGGQGRCRRLNVLSPCQRLTSEPVDDLCRLVLAAHRLGCTVKLAGVSDELCDLLHLEGVTDLLDDDQPNLDPVETDLR